MDLARRAIEQAGQGAGGAADHVAGVMRAGLAAAEGRPAEAVQLYRTAIAGLREYGCRFEVALAIFEMLMLLGPEESAVRSVLAEARETLTELRAAVLLERFEALASGTGGGSSERAGGRPTGSSPLAARAADPSGTAARPATS